MSLKKFFFTFKKQDQRYFGCYNTNRITNDSLGAKKSSCRAAPGAVVQVAHEQITFAKKPVIRLMWSAVMRSQKA